MAQFGSVHSRQVRNLRDGTLDLDEVFTEGYFDLDESGHCSQTKVICIENTHNMLGGLVLQVKVDKLA